MKKIFFLILLCTSTLAYSKNPTYCTQISDSDLRNLCYALAGNPNACVMINNNDMRNFCYALQ